MATITRSFDISLRLGSQLLKPKNFSTKNGELFEGIMTYGNPEYERVRVFSNYILKYNPAKKIPEWVYERLSLEHIRGKVKRKRNKFTEDTHFPHGHRANLSDYKGSGFDRGHMAAAGNYKKCHKSKNETFNLSNITPQVGTGFNQGYYNRIEQAVRRIFDNQDVKEVHVVTGSLFMPKDGSDVVVYRVIGENQVAVPTHIYKVILVLKKNDVFENYAMIIPNEAIDESKPFSDFACSIEKVEKKAGLIFFKDVNQKHPGALNKKSRPALAEFY
jgi:endonuclease G, mitochondrial